MIALSILLYRLRGFQRSAVVVAVDIVWLLLSHNQYSIIQQLYSYIITTVTYLQ